MTNKIEKIIDFLNDYKREKDNIIEIMDKKLYDLEDMIDKIRDDLDTIRE